MVEEELYRSGMPHELNFPFLEKLNIKTVIYLGSEDPSQKFLHFMDDQEIRFFHLGAASASSAAVAVSAANPNPFTTCAASNNANQPWDPISEETVLDALDLILNPSNLPIILMCHLGRHRTGTIVGCLRKLQHWNLTAIFEEYRRYAGPKVRLLNEQFIELFDTDLVRIPQSAPLWL